MNNPEWERMAGDIAIDGDDSSIGQNVLSDVVSTLQGTRGKKYD